MNTIELRNSMNSKALMSIYLGVFSLLMFFMPVVALTLGTLSIFLGLSGRKEARDLTQKGAGTAVAGAVCGASAIVLTVMLLGAVMSSSITY
ncbi:hypothetical protein [Alkalicoccus luteus]|uniref:DUF4190 domain-containing protein n=1 Tax=Alkalicoccus luteus TaxID=1237094 RepID=A0A969PQ81_9BACI|nr:hypothetical protein [Alkalicoccus luteus]NJP37560.1 hypothetical protein [Alkalicoccus luteus]